MSKKGNKNIKSKKVNKKVNKKDYTKLIISFVLLVLVIYLFIYMFDGNYTVSFDSDGGSVFSNLTVKKHEEVVLPKPVKEGYHFIGWKDENGEYVGSNYKVNGSVKLKADYRLEFVVTFVYNNGEENTTATVLENQNVIAPSDPVRKGYKFAGWYNNGIKYDFDSIVSSNITLEAKWNKK